MRVRSPRRAAQLGAAVVGMALAFVYRFSPGIYGFYPACPVATWLHMECPGCGSTRALYALLHFQMGEAVALNPLFPALFLVAMALGVAQYLSATWRNRFLSWKLPPAVYWVGSSAMLAFFLVRNL